jgi:hypothetical protein
LHYLNQAKPVGQVQSLHYLNQAKPVGQVQSLHYLNQAKPVGQVLILIVQALYLTDRLSFI